MTTKREQSWWLAYTAAVTCWLIMVAYSFTTAPMPGVNETHYIGKSRHFWQPEWCSRDLLMGSLDAHYVFCWTFGALANVTDLAVATFAGRLIGLALLAVAWVSLTERLTGRTRCSIGGLTLFLLVHQIENLSGEWVIGGIEGKVPAWAFGLFAIRYFLDRRWLPVGIHIGLSMAFHPVVGAWVGLALGTAGIWRFFKSEAPGRSEIGSIAAAVLLAALVALPGVIPAAAALRSSEVPTDLTGEVRDHEHMQNRANYVQVFGRLQHHLDPMDFGFSSWIWYVALSTVAFVLARYKSGFEDAKRIWSVVGATGIFAVVSLFIAWGPRPGSEMAGWEWKARLLKVYPFRLFDALLPMIIGLQLAYLLMDLLPRKRQFAGVVAAAAVLLFVTAPRGPSVTNPPNRTDWVAACEWVYSNTDPQTLFVSPRESKDFKWIAQRAEYVNHKDIPQDAAGIVEWNRRLNALQAWRQQSLDNGKPYSRQDLAALRKLSSAEYLMTHRIGPIEIEPVYSNSTYRIYELPSEP